MPAIIIVGWALNVDDGVAELRWRNRPAKWKSTSTPGRRRVYSCRPQALHMFIKLIGIDNAYYLISSKEALSNKKRQRTILFLFVAEKCARMTSFRHSGAGFIVIIPRPDFDELRANAGQNPGEVAWQDLVVRGKANILRGLEDD